MPHLRNSQEFSYNYDEKTKYYPDVPQSNYYPDVLKSNYYPDVPQSNYYPDVPQTNYYPEAPQKNYYPTNEAAKFDPFPGKNDDVLPFKKIPVVKDEKVYVGFGSLPDQFCRKSLKKVFEFNVMVAGESGLGKSTIINNLFLTDLYQSRKFLNVEERINKTTEIESKTIEIEEKGVHLRLTVIDTPGFGDTLNGLGNIQPIEQYINQAFEDYLKGESGLERNNIPDRRVHCCLYFISPFGYGLKQLDIEFMTRLHKKVNIIPIIGKADTLSIKEMKKFKENLLKDIEKHQIHIYQLPECDCPENEELKKRDMKLKASIPFCVIGSNTFVEINGNRVRGRLYPWGVVESENPHYSDFLKLKQLLIGIYMHDLMDHTKQVLYENFRIHYLCRASTCGLKSLENKECSKLEGNQVEHLIEQKDKEIRAMQLILRKMQNQLKCAETSPRAVSSGSSSWAQSCVETTCIRRPRNYYQQLRDQL